MTMTALKMCSLHKEIFYGDVLLSSWVFVWKKYPERWVSSVSGIIDFCVYIKSVPPRKTRYMFITT